jgi:beta-barrel assembly-enhancing protease
MSKAAEGTEDMGADETSGPQLRLPRRAFMAGISGAALLSLPGCKTAEQMLNDPAQLTATLGRVVKPFTITAEQEIQIGDALYGPTIDRSGGAYANGRAQASLQRFAEPLFQATQRPDVPWEIVLLDEPSVNAWALPGGKLAVNRGLLAYAGSEEQLAAVVAHEMGHVHHSHGISAIRTNELTGTATSILGDALADEMAQSRGGALSRGLVRKLEGPLADLVTSGYSREAEREADAYILTMYGRLGYDPVHAPEFFETLVGIIPPSESLTTSLFSTHPDTRERISLLESASAPSPTSVRPPSPDFAALKGVFPTRHHFRRA